MKSSSLILASTCVALGMLTTAASAGPRYRTHDVDTPLDVPVYRDPYYRAPYRIDPAYGVPPVGIFFMRHSTRCEYPNGFNQTDFGRSLGGIPRGGAELAETGCARAVIVGP